VIARHRIWIALGVSCVVPVLASCGAVLGLEDLKDRLADSSVAIGSDDGGPSVGGDAGQGADSADAGCSCVQPFSAYLFSDSNNLGRDFFGRNDMTTIVGTPRQSAVTPNGFAGYSIQLDGVSSACIDTGGTFNATADHTVCWWSQPAALAEHANQFAQFCTYDTWTGGSGADYVWHINNCGGGTTPDLQVPNTYSVGKWVQICQTYSRASLNRTVVVNGATSNKVSVTDTVPVAASGARWCIGSYGNGGFWTGLIYRPMWFDRVLTDQELAQAIDPRCCLH